MTAERDVHGEHEDERNRNTRERRIADRATVAANELAARRLLPTLVNPLPELTDFDGCTG